MHGIWRTLPLLMLSLLLVSNEPAKSTFASTSAADDSCNTLNCIYDKRMANETAKAEPKSESRPAADSECNTLNCIYDKRLGRETATAKPKPQLPTSKSGSKKRPRIQYDSADAEGLFSDDPNLNAAQTGAGLSCPTGTCGPGITPASQNLRDLFDLGHALNVINTAKRRLDLNRKCTEFASQTQVNSWGKEVIRQILKPNMSKLYEGTSDIIKLCPKYETVDEEEKISFRAGFWILLVSGWAQAESSCDPTNSFAGAPNGIANGLLGLHLGKEQTYSSACKKNDSYDPLKSIDCGLGMLKDRANKNLKVFDDHHFETLNPNASPRNGKRLSEATIIKKSLEKYCDDAGIKTANR